MKLNFVQVFKMMIIIITSVTIESGRFVCLNGDHNIAKPVPYTEYIFLTFNFDSVHVAKMPIICLYR